MGLKRSKGGGYANHSDIETGENYWISGIKKTDSNRHWSGGGIIQIDRSTVDQYKELKGMTELKESLYRVIELDNHVPKDKIFALENDKHNVE